MTQYPRRTLLGGIGMTIAASVTAGVATADETTAASTGPEFDSVLSFLPGTVASESMMLTVTDLERQLEANEPHDPASLGGGFQIQPDDVSKTALVYSLGEDLSRPIKVLTGDIDLEGDVEAEDSHAGIDYERYETDEVVAAVTDDVVIIAPDTPTVEDALEANAGETDRLLEADSRLEEGLETYDAADGLTVSLTDEYYLPDKYDDVAIEYVVQAMTVIDPDTIEMRFGIRFEDEDDVTDALIESLTGEYAYVSTREDPEVEVDGSLATVTVERDLEAERAIQEHDSPGFLRVDRDIDLDDDYLEIEVGRGDPTPIEDLTLEVGDEEYDREIWADGHGTLEEGDTIRIEMDDVEPNLSLHLSHDHELGSSGSGTTILGNLRFAFEYDHDEETLSVEYEDDFPLDGDGVSLAVYDHGDADWVRPDEDEPEPRTTVQPWEDQTVSQGDAHTLEDVHPGDEIVVGWNGISRRDGLRQYQVNPPGVVSFEYDYAAKTLSATLEPSAEDEGDDLQPAAAYELRIDEEPTASQWADEAESVPAEGTTVTVDDVEIGVRATAVWGDDELRVGSTRTMPSVLLEATDGTIEHVGGDVLAGSDLEAEVWTESDRETIDLEDEIDGEFTEGDTLEVDDDVQNLTLVYDDEHRIGWVDTTRE
ncbi:hypothetical protein EA462_00015 [Natrarchaeobius halalkaliphilus]|uniref:Uncharacterized protein n=1 Tax=Natrarchaeobius halalkaliphilus TaxID=1679091 RepID=A0A3N6M8T6_9EURY|nr:hypothetical protein [Natrarchaeobius halalkaliphilus]RQG92660.1 hypothetical protein EA462_00015 [Natrarchaeobius halalkaliphilus]